MGQTEPSNPETTGENTQPTKRRRRREGKWDTVDESVSLVELKAKTSEEESKKRLKRLYIGNLPSGMKLNDVVEFFNGALMALLPSQPTTLSTALNSSNPNDKLVDKTEIYNPDQGYCFLEFKTPEVTDLAFKLDGINCNGYSLKIRRPIDFTQSSTTEDTKIFIQNIPLEVNEDELQMLLEKHGKLKLVNLIRDPVTRASKGYGFFEYEDVRSAKMAIFHLNGTRLHSNVISVKQAAFGYFSSGGRPIDCKASNLPSSITQSILSNPLLGLQIMNGRLIGAKPTRVVQLINMIFREDLISDYNYKEIVRLTREEGSRYGKVEEIVIPRPSTATSATTSATDCGSPNGGPTTTDETSVSDREDGVGKVFIKFSQLIESRKAQYAFNGRVFDKNRIVCAAFYPEDKFNNEEALTGPVSTQTLIITGYQKQIQTI